MDRLQPPDGDFMYDKLEVQNIQTWEFRWDVR